MKASALSTTVTLLMSCDSTFSLTARSVLSPEMSFCVTGTVAAVLGRNVISSSRAYTPESVPDVNTPTRICAWDRCPVQSSTAYEKVSVPAESAYASYTR